MSRKSALDWKPRLKRTLKRKIGTRFFEAADARIFFGAYKLGAFGGLPSGLDAGDFKAAVGMLIERSMGLWVIEADRPIGAVFGAAGSEAHHLWVEPVWFPWATPRQRLEGALRFILDNKNEFLIMAAFRQDDKRFAEHLSRYGVMTRIAKVPKWFGEEDGMLFRSIK
jgi:hypothetical protein|tara:strand:- start:2197 stop:2700 length:504 start_codon:yes stop_codon:yes gene_type:complete